MSNTEKRFGLLGRNISYSFSKKYFTQKFRSQGLDHYEYVNYDLNDIEEFQEKVLKDKKILGGLNVTIPYKEQVIKKLDEIDDEAKKIGAVNTIKILENGKLKGYNTDAFGFETSLRSCWRGVEKGALILGTGGASKAIAHVIAKLGMPYLFVSRGQTGPQIIVYNEVDKDILQGHDLIINCSPVGTFPDIDSKPELPYKWLTERHLLYDLIYNPETTAFLKMGKRAGAITCNGYAMLVHQAERSWEIWNS